MVDVEVFSIVGCLAVCSAEINLGSSYTCSVSALLLSYNSSVGLIVVKIIGLSPLLGVQFANIFSPSTVGGF